MRKKNLVFAMTFPLMVLSSVVLSSCASSQSTRREVTASGLFPTQVNMIITPTIADLDVKNTKIEYSNTYQTSNTEEAKKLLLADAALANKVDLIVTPQYNIVVISTPESTLCKGTVYGYPASFTNFRKVTESDCTPINLNQINGQQDVGKIPTEQSIRIFKSNK